MVFKEFIEEAYDTIQNLQILEKEIQSWRSRYVDSEMKNDTNQARAYFMFTPSHLFIKKTIDENANECRREASDG